VFFVRIGQFDVKPCNGILPLETLQFRDDAEEEKDKTDEVEVNQSSKYISEQTTTDLENLKLLLKNVFFLLL
jgi:hypothetical protein